MTELLIYAYILLNIAILIIYWRKELGVLQFPFLIACVSLTFVAPQLFGIFYSKETYRSEMILPLSIMISCNLALYVGYYWGVIKKITRYKQITDHGNLLSIIVFTAIGATAYFMNRGEYKGGFVSGTYVIINFFTQYLSYSLILVILILSAKKIHLKKNSQLFLYLILFFIIAINIDRITSQARRAEAIQFILIIAYFAFLKLKKSNLVIRLIIPMIFIGGMISGSQITRYRNNAYAGRMTVEENLNDLSFENSITNIASDDGEIRNAMIGINYVSRTNSYDFGLFNINNIIVNYVPKSFLNSNIKQALMIDTGNNELVAELTKSGSTMTGYYDSFKSFGPFAFIKFLIIGFVMGVLWRKISYDNYYLLPYFGTLTAALLLITHSSGNCVSALIFWGIFVMPFIKKSRVIISNG